MYEALVESTTLNMGNDGSHIGVRIEGLKHRENQANIEKIQSQELQLQDTLNRLKEAETSLKLL